MNRTRFLSTSLAVALLGALATLEAAEPALARLVPGDAAVVFGLYDLPGLRREFPDSNIGRAWADPEIQRFLAPLLRHVSIAEMVEKVKSETGYTPTELLDFATGDILLTVPASSLSFSKDQPGADALLAIDVGANQDKLRELIDEQQKRDTAAADRTTTEDHNGVTLYIEAPAAADQADASASTDAETDDSAGSPASTALGEAKPVVWAFHEGRWFIASNRELVTGALDALAAGGVGTSLDASADYQAVLTRSGGEADVLFFVDWKAIYPGLVSGLEAARDPNERPNMFGIEPLGVMKALGLDTIESFSVSAVTIGDTDRLDAALLFREARGLTALLAYRDGPVSRPDWVPASWFNVSSQNFSVLDAFDEIERSLERLSPMLASMFQGQVRTYERQLGIDLRRDLVGALGTSFVSGYSTPPAADGEASPTHAELDQFVGIALADPTAFERTLETIKTKFLPPGDASPLKSRDYLGRTLHSFEAPEGGRGVTYAITDGWLLLGVGSPSTVESVVQLMHTPNPDASFWQRKDVRAALADVPPGAFSVQHSELAPLFAALAASFSELQDMQADDERFVDPEATPDRAVFERHFKHTVSHGVRADDGLHFHSEGPAR